ncbi:MAG: glucose-1-phosphate adenylyltransferase subunit GlgD [Clostridia bacterium]|nr:glucose-1-phosphate adenylyltransferase subunit GlgD [Clostridia bacterium]
MAASTVGVIFSSINDEYVPELTRVRSIGSVPYGGRYRLVDFPLSNMVNAGITTVGVITRNNYQSLMDHLGSGKYWDLARKDGGLILLPPYSDESETLYKNRLEALKSCTSFLRKSNADYVVLADANAVYKLDYSKIIDYHIKNNADITLAYHEHVFDGRAYMTFRTDTDERINEIEVDTAADYERKNYIGVMVFRRSHLLSIIQNAIKCGYKSLSRDVLIRELPNLRIYGYKYEGFYADISSLSAYFKANMALLDCKIRNEIYGARDIYTKVNDSPPAKICDTGKIKNSLISDGCLIEGTVENCVLFRGVKVGKGTVVRNCVIMSETEIGENCTLSYVVCDKETSISDGIILAGIESQPYFIHKGTNI